MSFDLNQIITVLQTILPNQDKMIALHEPHFSGNEWQYVKECLDTGWVSSVGKFVDQFERDLAEFTGAKYAIATGNGTSALHICYLLADIKPGDEILVPTLTFIGTINPIIYCGAIPHFVEAEKNYFGIDIQALADYLKEITEIKGKVCFNKLTGRPIRALCAMHTLGHPVDLDSLVELCEQYHLTLLEDAAEALGSYYKGVHVGHRGLLGALSFNGNKIITTGGGGAILTNDAELAKRAKHITTTAKRSHPWLFEHDQIAYNYRLPNINAAVGCAQLEKLPEFLRVKRLLAEKYQTAFSNMKEINVTKEPQHSKSNYWLNALVLDGALSDHRDQLLKMLNDAGMMARPLWNLQHTLPMFKDYPRMSMRVAEELQRRVINVPSSVTL